MESVPAAPSIVTREPVLSIVSASAVPVISVFFVLFVKLSGLSSSFSVVPVTSVPFS